jgi:DNA-directed RNA polymerase
LPTPAQIDEQIRLEREQIRQGLKLLHNNTKKLEDKSYASASVYGVVSIEQLIPLVVERIKTTNNYIKERHTGRAFKEIHHFLADLEPEAAACIALKVLFDCVFSTRGLATITNTVGAIGQAVENECMMRHYENKVPGLVKVLRDNYFHRSIGTHQKVKVITTLMNRYDVDHWKPWGQINRVKLGGWLADCICEVSGYFMKHSYYKGKRQQVVEIVPTPAFLERKDEIMAQAELFSPLAWPMLIEPNDWTTDGKHGGYLLNEVMRGYDMVRRGKPTVIQGENPVAFLNRIQKVAYTLNPFIVNVAETLMEKQIQVGKFIPIIEVPLPPKPPDIAENAVSRQDYRRRAAEVCNQNAQAFKKSCRTRMTMNAVERFKDVDKFFIPWSFDYRGRAYPIPAFLTPQDTDFGKSLLKFYEHSFVVGEETEEWLAFQVATTYGLDKASMQERQQWVESNKDLIKRIAKDPIANRPEWETADEPWSFLAACDEYYHCVIECDRHHTSLPVAVDATCSGLQILAGLARDASTAKLVNVLPSDKPQDAYKVIAEQAKPHVPVHLQQHMDRKTTKRTVMTVPYNAKPFSNRGYIRDALKEKGVEVEKEDLTAVVKAVRGAMDVIVPGPMRVMKWIEQEVSNAIDRGLNQLTWVTPSGFVVTQKLMKKDTKRIELQLLGSCRVTVSEGDTKEVDKNHHKNATAPNLIHSLDASLLHLSTIRFDAPISLIHDSVLCRASDMSVLSTIVRETYMHLFAEHDYLTDWAQQIGAESEPPIIDTLQPESVIDSIYFFC